MESSAPTHVLPPMESKSGSVTSILDSISTGSMAKTPDSSPEKNPAAVEWNLDRIEEPMRTSPESDDMTESVTQMRAQVPSTKLPYL